MLIFTYYIIFCLKRHIQIIKCLCEKIIIIILKSHILGVQKKSEFNLKLVLETSAIYSPALSSVRYCMPYSTELFRSSLKCIKYFMKYK